MSMHVVRRDCDTCGEGVLPLTLVEGEDELYGMTMEDAASIHASLSAILGKPPLGAPAPSVLSVRVRIAIDVDADGQHGVGYDSDAATSEYENAFGENGLRRHIVYVTASVPLPPEPVTVQGVVVPGAGGGQ